MPRTVVRTAATCIALALIAPLFPTPALATPTVAPHATGTQLEGGNIVLMRPGVAYNVQLAGEAADVALSQTDLGDGSRRNQIYVNGSMVRDYIFPDYDAANGDVFLVNVTASDTLIYQRRLAMEGKLFIHSVVFRFDGKNLIDATKLDDSGYADGWFELDQAYDSRAGGGAIVTTFGGITNTCNYVKAQVACVARVPRPTFSGTLKVGRQLTIRPPVVGAYSRYLWYRCNAKGKKCKGIMVSVKEGLAAIEPTYRLRHADKRKRISICLDYGYRHWTDWVCSKASAKVK